MTQRKKRKKINLEVHLPGFVTKIFPRAIWTLPNSRKEIYLTFDDGPIPGVTPAVLDLLRKEGIKATFFCVGENVFKYPEVYQQVLDEGHAVGNHTYNHYNGLKKRKTKYLSNIEKAGELIESNLFRPPYGFMRWSQYHTLKKQYKIIMWDVISCDYKRSLSKEQVVANVLDYIRPGSIVTFHDHKKTYENIMYALPRVIKELKTQGYTFNKIEFEKKVQLRTPSYWNKLLQLRSRNKKKSA